MLHLIHIVEIMEDALEEERKMDHKLNFKTVDGSSLFQIIIFVPNSSTFKASSRLCLCDRCKVSYGSCDLFKEYHLEVQILNQVSLRAYVKPVTPLEIVGKEEGNDFVLPGSYVAVAASKDSFDTVWFIQVVETNKVNTKDVKDDYGLVIGKIDYFENRRNFHIFSRPLSIYL